MEPRLLIIETSGKTGHVAVALGGRLLGSRQLEESRRHARDLAPFTRELLAEQNWKARDLQGVIVSRGPGSYTGLRVGLMSAKTLAFAIGCRLLMVPTFEVLAHQAGDVPIVAVLADAQQGKVYVQRFAGTVPQTELAIHPFDDWLRQQSNDVWLTGPGLAVPGRMIPEGRLIVPPDRWQPRPECVLSIGLARFMNGESDDVWSAEPLYLRPSAAETQWTALGR
jgi:tRNA threonylcarbamoyladenosine biosynthesis protein TsaB